MGWLPLTPATLAAIAHCVPAQLPLAPPAEGSQADSAGLFRQIGLFHRSIQHMGLLLRRQCRAGSLRQQHPVPGDRLMAGNRVKYRFIAGFLSLNPVILMAVVNKGPALTLVALALALAAQSSVAQQSFLIDAGPCINLATAVERLVCFEQQVREAQELQGVAPALVTRPAPAQPEAPQPTSPQPTTSRQAGVPQAVPVPSSQAVPDLAAAPAGEAAFGLPEEQDQNAVPEELLGTIAAVRQFAPNQVSVTLTNGQVWRQKVSERYPIRVGQNVRIYATRWGSDFRLTVPGIGRFIQVERVK
jgi:hypothetical protein